MISKNDSTQIFCGMCRNLAAANKSSQLIPCLHTICMPCFEKHLLKSQVCPIQHCYSSLALSPDQKWSACMNEKCERKLCDAEVSQSQTCQHSLCGKCYDDAYKNDKPTCPVTSCNTLLEEDDKEKCAGPCGDSFESIKLQTFPCCQIRICSSCTEKVNRGKGTCAPGKCQPLDKRPKKGKKATNFRKASCQGTQDCEGEVLRNFPSALECEHMVCLSCLNAILDECERKGIAPICPAESCRLPYRCATVLALKALFPEKIRYFNRFELNSHFSMETLRDDTNLHICENGATLSSLIEIKNDDNQYTLQFDPTGSFGDLIREIRRILKIMPWTKVYGYFRRDGTMEDGDRPIIFNPKTITKRVADMLFTKQTTIMVDINGIVNSKRKPSKVETKKDNKN